MPWKKLWLLSFFSTPYPIHQHANLWILTLIHIQYLTTSCTFDLIQTTIICSWTITKTSFPPLLPHLPPAIYSSETARMIMLKQIKTFQWLPSSLKVKSKGLTMSNHAPPDWCSLLHHKHPSLIPCPVTFTLLFCLVMWPYSSLNMPACTCFRVFALFSLPRMFFLQIFN